MVQSVLHATEETHCSEQDGPESDPQEEERMAGGTMEKEGHGKQVH